MSAPRVISVQDLDYEIPIHSAYTPSLIPGAEVRMSRQFPELQNYINTLLQHPASKRVWGIIVESDKTPLFVAQNLACNVRSSTYRRFLRISVPCTPTGISAPVCNTHQTEECDPLPSVMM